MSGAYNQLKATNLLPHLIACGYSPSNLIEDIEVTEGHRVALTAFARPPHDSRSACIAVIDRLFNPVRELNEYLSLGAPLFFLPAGEAWQLWSQRAGRPVFVDPITPEELSEYFIRNRALLAPDAVYRAKTWARFDTSYQLSFVDIGLMPLVEEEAGQKLSALIERVVLSTKESLGWDAVTDEQGRWMLKSNFWLLAARILKDKSVPAFIDLDLKNVEQVFALVGEHYEANAPFDVLTVEQREALQQSALEISRYGHLGVVSTEVLSYIYENALITKATRRALGTHSTPAYLVDYVVGKLRPWIEDIPEADRQVFEPACGHAAFLVASMRLLGDLLRSSMRSPQERHSYFRHRLHGVDFDDFALEIARLSLTLADVPNPNGWDLRVANMFKDDLLARYTQNASIILANPPFENFEPVRRPAINGDLFSEEAITFSRYSNQAAEMLWRLVTHAQPGSVLGVVLPQKLLHSRQAKSIRKILATDFEISEICLFPDKVFNFSDAESAVILARKSPHYTDSGKAILYRRVRESGISDFKTSYAATQNELVQQARFSESNNWSFFIPSLERVWEFLDLHPYKFGDVADIGKGFDFRSEKDPKFPQGAIKAASEPFDGCVKGFKNLHAKAQTHELPKEWCLNVDPSVVKTPRYGTITGIPQVLVNYSPVSRGPWRLKAFIDLEGHAFTSCFVAIRPVDSEWPLEVLWALTNSPVANAFAYTHSSKRHVYSGLLRRMPVPALRLSDISKIQSLVQAYLLAATGGDNILSPVVPSETLKQLHWRIDAELLRLYELPKDLQKHLLDLFSGEIRRGVPFMQKRYLPEGFSEAITLDELLAVTVDWEQVNVQRSHLIRRKIDQSITKEEAVELQHLQHLTDIRIKMLAPLPIAQLELVRKELQRRGVWEED